MSDQNDPGAPDETEDERQETMRWLASPAGQRWIARKQAEYRRQESQIKGLAAATIAQARSVADSGLRFKTERGDE